MIKATLLILLFIFSSPTWAVDSNVSVMQTLELVLFDDAKAPTTAPRDLYLLDTQSGKVAKVTLRRHSLVSSLWGGLLSLQILGHQPNSKTLEFSLEDKMPLYTYTMTNESMNRVYLFKSEADAGKFLTDWEKREKTKWRMSVNNADLARKVMLPIERVPEVEIAQPAPLEPSLTAGTSADLELVQAMERARLMEQQAAQSDFVQASRKKSAKDLAQEADRLYAEQKYNEAQIKYAQAIQLDAEEDSYFYRYGVTLYKVSDFKKSLATLSLAEVPPSLALEKQYYLALNHLMLQDYEKAGDIFKSIRSENDPNLSPVSSYFAGSIEIQQQKYQDARSSMEYVLDHSKNPELDRSADELLTEIDRLIAFHDSKKEKFRLTGFLGAVYDGNVLNIAVNNISTDVQAFRLNYGASALGIWSRTPTSNFGTRFSITDYYSTNTSFEGDPILQTADPLQMELSFPYFKEIALSEKKTLHWDISPSFRSIYMSPTGGTRDEAIRSLGINTSISTALRGDLLMSVLLDLAKEDTLLDFSKGDDDQSGLRYGLTLMPTWLMNIRGDKSLTADVGYLMHQAEGRNYRYKRMSFGVSYNSILLKNVNTTLRAEYSSQSYDEAVSSRVDSNPILSASFNKNLKRNLNWLVSLQYNVGTSNEEAYSYNKFVVSSVLSFSHSILE